MNKWIVITIKLTADAETLLESGIYDIVEKLRQEGEVELTDIEIVDKEASNE